MGSNYGPSPGPPGTDTDPWNAIRQRPTMAVPVGALSASQRLTTRPGIVVGWHLRDASGTGGAEAAVVDVDASSANAAAANNVTLPGVAGRTTYLTGFEITGDGATAGSIIAVTVTGILGGTKTYFLTVPAGAGAAITPLIVQFARPLPASGPNVAIVVNVPSFGAGNTNAAVTAHGFQSGASGVSSAAFIADLFDGGDATGQLIGTVTIGPDGYDTSDIGDNGPYFRIGLFVNVIQGAAQGAIWIKI